MSHERKTCDAPLDVVAALADPDVRAILTATSEKPQTVSELVDRCEIPTATAYRKTDDLVEAGLLQERLLVRPSGRNAREYVCPISDVRVAIDGSGTLHVECLIEPDERNPTAASDETATNRP